MKEKAPWLLELNGGSVPVLEFPDGRMIYDSGVLTEFANDYAKGKGYELFFEDPFLKAQQRLTI
jgi:glutathione S-transferase